VTVSIQIAPTIDTARAVQTLALLSLLVSTLHKGAGGFGYCAGAELAAV
jgi:hypothetical protein